MVETARITVVRQWKTGAPIETFCSIESVGSRMDALDFVKAVAAGIGNPAFIVTKNQLRIALIKASEAVVAEMKQATRAVV